MLRYLSWELFISQSTVELYVTRVVASPEFLGSTYVALLLGMLKLDSKHRLSAIDCLRDSWLQRISSRKRRRFELKIVDERSAKRLRLMIDSPDDHSAGDEAIFSLSEGLLSGKRRGSLWSWIC